MRSWSSKLAFLWRDRTNVKFINGISEVLKRGGVTSATLSEKKVLAHISGGSNLRFFADTKAFRKLSRKYAVFVDGDIDENGKREPGKANLINRLRKVCVADGAKLYETRKREIENYLHAALFQRKFGRSLVITDHENEKEKLKAHLVGTSGLLDLVKEMTADELRERDKYFENGVERHEIVEMMQDLLRLAD